MTSEVIEGYIRVILFLPLKEFDFWDLEFFFIKTNYACFYYERHSIFLKMSKTSKVMRSHKLFLAHSFINQF